MDYEDFCKRCEEYTTINDDIDGYCDSCANGTHFVLNEEYEEA